MTSDLLRSLVSSRDALTFTSDHLLAGGLRARLEYRTDSAKQAIFPSENGQEEKAQTTLTVGLVYSFAGTI